MGLHDLPEGWQHADVKAGLTLVQHFRTAVDCGAHRGVITGLLAEHFTEVVAIEPSELAERINFPNVRVIQKALGDRVGRVGMAHGPHNTGQRHVIEGDAYDMVTLDSLGLTPDFIKVDVEGMEWHVVTGGEHTLRTYRPVIMFEENGLNARYGIADGAVGQLLESWGATLGLIRRGSPRHADYVYHW